LNLGCEAVRCANLSSIVLSFSLSVRYVLFAIVAGIVNLLTQAVVFRFSTVEPLATSIFIGTVAGFILKYILDKSWIFFDDHEGTRREVRKILLYGSFSVTMTLVFWSFEVAFWKIGGTVFAKYLGAIIGLAIGNFAKYLLDRNFTFDRRAKTWK
jgi:putative flippase GtrA